MILGEHEHSSLVGTDLVKRGHSEREVLCTYITGTVVFFLNRTVPMYRVTERDHRAAVERPLEPPLGRGRIVVNPLISGTGTLQDSMKSFLTAIHSQRLNC